MFISIIVSPLEIVSMAFLDPDDRVLMRFHCTKHLLFWNEMFNTDKSNLNTPWVIKANVKNPWVRLCCDCACNQRPNKSFRYYSCLKRLWLLNATVRRYD